MTTTNALLDALTTAVSSTIASLTPTPIVRGFRANPISRNQPEIMISLLSTQPSPFNTVGAMVEFHDLVILCHAPYLKSNIAEMEAAERGLNDLQDLILAALPAWRSSTDPALYPWQKIIPFRAASRPPSPRELVQYRLGQIYVRIYL